MASTTYKYTNPADPAEAAVRFEIVENNGGRAMIRPVNLDFTIAPIENVAREEIEPCECW